LDGAVACHAIALPVIEELVAIGIQEGDHRILAGVQSDNFVRSFLARGGPGDGDTRHRHAGFGAVRKPIGRDDQILRERFVHQNQLVARRENSREVDIVGSGFIVDASRQGAARVGQQRTIGIAVAHGFDDRSIGLDDANADRSGVDRSGSRNDPDETRLRAVKHMEIYLGFR